MRINLIGDCGIRNTVLLQINDIKNTVMNKIKPITWCALVALLLFIFSSCEDYLTIDEVENRTIATDYYDSPQKLEQAVVGIYVDMRRALLHNHAWLMYGEGRAGDLTLEVDFMDDMAAQRLTNGTLPLRQLTDWGYFYDAIQDANYLLEKLGSAKGEMLSSYQYNLYRGEALALKSMAYFYLTRIWGTVPSAEATDRGKLLTQQEVLTRCVQWAAEAKPLLPRLLLNDDGIVSTALTEVRFNKTAVCLLLAHQQLWLGKGQEAYDGLTAVFEGQGADSLSNLGLSLGKDSDPDITQQPYTGNPITITKEKLDAIYPVGDTRRSMFTIPEAGTTASLIIEEQNMLLLYSTKEISLLMAEAAWRAGQLETAKSHLTTAAIGATENYALLTAGTFADALLRERQRILMGSGQRFFDLIRFDKIRQFLPSYTESDITLGAAYWPLSAQSIRTNGLEQNKYWSK
ncbi:hypothetical protein C4F40_18050 [Sphingobacterium sp. Ka21]|uniref:SusD-like N-terminal domain-containing protein n=2 Tax=Sphingobacterium pedocola TaxID=2082722 RepID=A0ABR9TBA5_9SPHI|nr:hypothetical protein [Sphingobacterium pedocola]